MYLTYAEYQAYGGTLDEPLFNDLAFESESYINYLTFNRLKKFTVIPEEVKRCEFALIRLAEEKRNLLNQSGSVSGESSATEGGVTSLSNDGVSVSYSVISASDLYKLLSNEELKTIVNRYLSAVVDSLGRKVLYRGIYKDDEA